MEMQFPTARMLHERSPLTDRSHDVVDQQGRIIVEAEEAIGRAGGRSGRPVDAIRPSIARNRAFRRRIYRSPQQRVGPIGDFPSRAAGPLVGTICRDNEARLAVTRLPCREKLRPGPRGMTVV